MNTSGDICQSVKTQSLELAPTFGDVDLDEIDIVKLPLINPIWLRRCSICRKWFKTLNGFKRHQEIGSKRCMSKRKQKIAVENEEKMISK